MKALFATLIFISSMAQARQAPTAPSIAIPTTAISINVQMATGGSCHVAPVNRDQVIEKAAAWNKENRTDLQCSAIYRKWVSTPKAEHRCAMLVLYQYCEPRDLQQQQIGSLYKACQEKPSEQCYRKEFLDYLKAFQMTNYFDVN
jgi:hypothetical protein